MLRQTTGFVERLFRLIGLGWAVPDLSTLSRRQKTLNVDIPYRGSNGPLHLWVDSTGIKLEGEGEWSVRKHGGPSPESPIPPGRSSETRSCRHRNVSVEPSAVMERMSSPQPAETRMLCINLLGQRLSARDFGRQVAELQVRVTVLNGFTALGTPITEAAG